MSLSKLEKRESKSHCQNRGERKEKILIMAISLPKQEKREKKKIRRDKK